MADANSSYTQWDRLYDAICAVDALAQIFCMFEGKTWMDVERFASVFGYMGSSLVQDRDAYLEMLTANCHEPMAVPAAVLGDAYVPAGQVSHG